MDKEIDDNGSLNAASSLDDDSYTCSTDSSESDDSIEGCDVVEDTPVDMFIPMFDKDLDSEIGSEFFHLNVEELKKRDRELMAKISSGHFRDKHRDSKLYIQMKEIHDRHTPVPLLRMLHHAHNTQGVESMNNSIASCAPKGRTFS